MKFNCGPTREEKDEKRLKKQEENRKKYSSWNKAFAWWPINIEGRDCRWLETFYYRVDFLDESDWHYSDQFGPWRFRVYRMPKEQMESMNN